jgi:hypothetical protein
MINRTLFRRLAFGLLTGVGLVVAAATAPIVIGSFSTAQAQVSAEFQEALTPFGSWRRHGRWGEVWVPGRRQSDWRPYEAGHWVYTEEWGWFWDTDDSEADWGWITYHYGRWMHDETGWFWIPGEEWAPAWVDWRYSNDYVGWAPLPPDDVEVAYESEPTIWVFVAPRYLTAPRWRTYIAPPQRRVAIFRDSRVVNRTVTFRERGRAAVNPGISPAFIASVTHKPVQSFRVSPHVVASTRGVTGAVTVRPQDSRANGPRGRATVTRVSVEKTNVVIKPDAKPPQAPQALGKGENGRLGNRPPRAAQGATPAATQPTGQPAAPNGQPRPAATPATPPAAAPAGKPAAPAAPAPAPAAAPKAPAAAPQAAPVARPPPPAAPPAQVRPQRPPPPPAPPPVAHPAPPPHPAAPAPPPVAHPAPPPAAARPAPPPVAHPAPPPAARPGPPPGAPPPKPGEKPPEPPK